MKFSLGPAPVLCQSLRIITVVSKQPVAQLLIIINENEENVARVRNSPDITILVSQGNCSVVYILKRQPPLTDNCCNTYTELQNVNFFTQIISFQLNLHRYICHICDIMQLCTRSHEKANISVSINILNSHSQEQISDRGEQLVETVWGLIQV